MLTSMIMDDARRRTEAVRPCQAGDRAHAPAERVSRPACDHRGPITVASLRRHFDRRRTQFVQRRELQCRDVRRLQVHHRRGPGVVRFLPARHADAPAIARLQAGEAPFGDRRRQVVARLAAEGEKLFRHPTADDVHADVFRAGVAAAVAVEAGARRLAAGLKWGAENVLRGGHVVSNSGHRDCIRTAAAMETRKPGERRPRAAVDGSPTRPSPHKAKIPVLRARDGSESHPT